MVERRRERRGSWFDEGGRGSAHGALLEAADDDDVAVEASAREGDAAARTVAIESRDALVERLLEAHGANSAAFFLLQASQGRQQSLQKSLGSKRGEI